jgi:outer membrane immunogenic protein
LWIVDGENSSAGTFRDKFPGVAPRLHFPAIDRPRFVQERRLGCARNSPRNVGCLAGRISGKRLEVCMNSRAFVGGIALAAGSVVCLCSAHAADLPRARAPAPMAPVAYVPAVYNWSGFYVGGNLGAGFADSSWSDPFTGAHNDFSKSGFIGGGQIGANVQFNALVLGIEGDFDWTGLKGSSHDSLGNAINTNTQWTSTVTGRVGAAFDRLLVYGKGGVAFAHDKDSLTDIVGNAASASLTRTGWTAGAGLEYAFAPNWSAKIEYDYLSFGPDTVNLATPHFPAYSANPSLNVQEVKAGINFKFGP